MSATVVWSVSALLFASSAAAAASGAGVDSLTPASLIDQAHRYYGGHGYVSVSGHLRFVDGEGQLWETSQAAETGESRKMCVTVTGGRRLAQALQPLDGEEVTLSGMVRRNVDREGVRRSGCNAVALELRGAPLHR